MTAQKRSLITSTGPATTQPQPFAQSSSHSAMTPMLYLEIKSHLVAMGEDLSDFIRDEAGNAPQLKLCADATAEHVITFLAIGCTPPNEPLTATVINVVNRLKYGKPVGPYICHVQHATHVVRVWRDRESTFAAFLDALSKGTQQLVEWAMALPGLEGDQCYQLLHALGAQIVNPRGFVARIAGVDYHASTAHDRFQRCQEMYRAIAAATGDSFSMIDRVLYVADFSGMLQVTHQPHRLTFTPTH